MVRVYSFTIQKCILLYDKSIHFNLTLSVGFQSFFQVDA